MSPVLGDRRPPLERFWEKVAIGGPDECWEWQGSLEQRAYGYFRLGVAGSRTMAPARALMTLVHGPIEPHLYVCHSCDNPPCVNPAHLFLGLTSANTADRDRKGRAARGERNGLARLTATQVVEMRRRYAAGGVSHRKLAAMYGVSSSTVGLVLTGTTWAPTEGPATASTSRPRPTT